MHNDVTDTVIAAAAEVVEREARAVRDVAGQIDQGFVDVASLLMSCTGKVILSGVGTSGFIARRAAHLFAVSGTPSLYLHPTEGLHGSLGALRADDILIVLSKGGSSAEVNELARRAQREGISVIALTCNADSPLADLADIAITLRTDDQADRWGDRHGQHARPQCLAGRHERRAHAGQELRLGQGAFHTPGGRGRSNRRPSCAAGAAADPSAAGKWRSLAWPSSQEWTPPPSPPPSS
ncbi:MAG: SIS domain-containing protein [Gemmatimonadaceae bacterium]